MDAVKNVTQTQCLYKEQLPDTTYSSIFSLFFLLKITIQATLPWYLFLYACVEAVYPTQHSVGHLSPQYMFYQVNVFILVEND